MNEISSQPNDTDVSHWCWILFIYIYTYRYLSLFPFSW